MSRILSVEQQKIVKEKREKKERREMLEAAVDKINQGIERNNSRSGERAIWELVQNARDLAKESAVIKIELTPEGLYFSHQGESFTIDSLSNLIKQQSSKRNDEETVGQYGTGFMTTHVFNRKVYISGDCLIDCGYDRIYVPLPDNFCLNRDFADYEREYFISEMEKELQSVEDLRLQAGNDEAGIWTTFHYNLSDNKIPKVADQLRSVCHLMPFVMVLNEQIQECTIKDEINHTAVTFTRENRIECEKDFDNRYSLHVATTILRTQDGNKEELILHTIESGDRDDVVFIPPMPNIYDNIDDIPSQFLFFPLLCSEHFGTNFIIHSKRMYPKESRDSYLWPYDNDSVIIKYKHNQSVLSEIIDMLFAYYDNDVNRQCIPLQFAKVSFCTDTDDTVARSFHEDLQKRFSDKFATWKMIPSTEGYQEISDNNGFGVLCSDIYQGLNDEQKSKYIPVIVDYASKVKSIPSEDVVGWSEVVQSWNSENQDWFINLNQICDKIQGVDGQFHIFLMLLHDMGKVGDELISTYPLIPNRKGLLRKKNGLKDGKDITDKLYELALPIIKDRADVIVNPIYADITQLALYTRKDLQKDLSEAVRILRKETLQPTLRKTLEMNEVQKLITCCSAYPTENPNNFRSRIMPIICNLYNIEYNLIYIKPIDNDEEDMYSSVFNFLIEQTMFMISCKTPDWLNAEKHREDLKEFIKSYVGDGKNQDKIEKIISYGIFPNMLGVMCRISDLKRKDSNIDEEFRKLYKKLFDKDLWEEFVDEDFTVFYTFQEMTAKEIGRQIEEKIYSTYIDNHNNDDENSLLLKVLSNFNDDNSKWKEFFPRIYAERQSIYYNLGTADDKKAMFTLQMKGSEALQRMAKLVTHNNFNEILEKAENMVAQQEEFERQFRFTNAIGTAIQDVIQSEINDEIKCIPVKNEEGFSTQDVQNGQDIIISYNGEELYYIECKAKWNFKQPAHMSSQQMKQAVRQKDYYALVCVDCTTDTGCKIASNANNEEIRASIDDILNHTYVHTDIGSIFSDIISSLVEKEDEEYNRYSEETIKIYGNLSCDIPKKKFINGKPYKEFINDLIKLLKDKIE